MDRVNSSLREEWTPRSRSSTSTRTMSRSDGPNLLTQSQGVQEGPLEALVTQVGGERGRGVPSDRRVVQPVNKGDE
eukprot:2860068-Lingulodinium_polyedra.AAC.1